MTMPIQELLRIPADDVHIEGMLELPANARGLVLFAHGSGSSRHSPRNNHVARMLHARGSGTLLLDLLTLSEDLDYHTRFDISLLTHRLLVASAYVMQHTPASRHLPIGYFGASTGAAAALQAAAALGDEVQAVVSRGGRADLAGAHELAKVRAPTLLLVGEADSEVLQLNRVAYAKLQCEKELSVIPDATHLFEEPGALDEVARQAADWFGRHWK
ncbi:dienelactone hydrolase family protein [Rhodoferax sp. BAB1]|uniref:dienelactone hydrolase family protein n=1 Tax=Rhodoferax sp. BAB1 TaxID=2741720 RepID=UPI0015766288|nr:alpha/beta family hydrolase [Rhodoferax sp. BAB1]QKO23143.1 dienelactone hydrolase family protein [Rhodoferax sp. BAB1]